MVENIINKAILFATEAHKGTVRKGSKLPYILHPLEAGVIVSSMTNDENVIAAAILHDVLEDTDVTYEELKKEYIWLKEVDKFALTNSIYNLDEAYKNLE